MSLVRAPPTRKTNVVLKKKRVILLKKTSSNAFGESFTDKVGSKLRGLGARACRVKQMTATCTNISFGECIHSGDRGREVGNRWIG